MKTLHGNTLYIQGCSARETKSEKVQLKTPIDNGVQM
jgi:hypothetical protein